jgi:uncharacterized protein Yka (UPF0111/DUF47 family)
MSDEFDFGFFAVDETELEAVQQTTAKAESAEKNVLTLQEKCDTLYNMVMPLLNNLAKNPEKDYIYWPNRLSKIEQFRDKLDEVYTG